MHKSSTVPVALALAAALAGCGGSGSNPPPPCATPRLLAYWTPGGTPQAGFQVPGQVAAGLPAQLGCAQAGVLGVQVFAGTPLTIVPCTGGGALCVDANTWRCDIPSGGVAIPTPAGAGVYDIQVDAYGDGANAVAAKYTRRQSVTVGACGDTAVGIFPQGIDGTMSLDYIFLPAVNCASGSHMEWDLFRGTGAGATLVEQGTVACGSPNPFLVNGGASLAAGVYTLDRLAEVVPGAPALSVHALCNTVIVHAGSEVVGGTAPVFLDLPASTQTCF